MRLFLALIAGVLALPLLLAPAAQAQDSYRIRPGDVLRIEVLEDPSLNRSVLVAPDGRVALPMAGAVAAAGRNAEAVQADLGSRLAANFAAAPTVYVAVERLGERTGGGAKAPATIRVHVMGEAGKPGRHEVAKGTTILQLFAEMGGFSQFAATKRVQLHRTDARTGDQKVYLFNYDAIERGQVAAGTTRVLEGDVIVVPQRRLFE